MMASGNKLLSEPMLTQIYVAMCHKQATMYFKRDKDI